MRKDFELSTRPAPIVRGLTREVADRLRSDPGVWHKVEVCAGRERARYRAQDLERGRYAHFRPVGDWQAYADQHNVIARYVGTFAHDAFAKEIGIAS